MRSKIATTKVNVAPTANRVSTTKSKGPRTNSHGTSTKSKGPTTNCHGTSTKSKVSGIASTGFVTLVLFAGASTSSAEVGQEWIVRHDGPAGLNDVAYAMTTDAAGNVYVTGTAAVGTSESDCVTIKYDPAGVQQWIQTFNGNSDDSGYAIVTDDLGNIYVAGISSSYAADYLTLKYDGSGALQWARHYDGPITEDDTATSIAVDADGSVYVTGYSTGEGTNWDYATVKYSALGQ